MQANPKDCRDGGMDGGAEAAMSFKRNGAIRQLPGSHCTAHMFKQYILKQMATLVT